MRAKILTVGLFGLFHRPFCAVGGTEARGAVKAMEPNLACLHSDLLYLGIIEELEGT